MSDIDALQAELDTATAHLEHMACAHDTATPGDRLTMITAIGQGHLRVRSLQSALAAAQAEAAAEAQAEADALAAAQAKAQAEAQAEANAATQAPAAPAPDEPSQPAA